MARFTQAEVLRRYQVGERDFRGADLRCLRFRGQTLAGADFSGADLRGTDFLDADLRGATFVGARCGVTWLRGLLERGAVVPFYSFFSGSIFSLTTSKFISVFFFGSESAIGHLDVTWASIATLIVLAALVVFAWEGFSAKGLVFWYCQYMPAP